MLPHNFFSKWQRKSSSCVLQFSSKFLGKPPVRLDALSLKSLNLVQAVLVRLSRDHRVSAAVPFDISFDGWLGQAGLRACTDSRHQTTLLQLPVSASVCRSASPALTARLVVLDVIGAGIVHTTKAKACGLKCRALPMISESRLTKIHM